MKMKALEIMKAARSVEDRANDYVVSIKRNLQVAILDKLLTQRDKLVDEIQSTLDFSLATDLNAGIASVTREQAENKFKKVIENLEYELVLVEQELKAKQEIFNKYFGEE